MLTVHSWQTFGSEGYNTVPALRDGWAKRRGTTRGRIAMSHRVQLLVVGLGCWLLAGCGPPAVGEPIWIGHLAPLSGPDRAQGEQARQGIELAVTELASTEKKP